MTPSRRQRGATTAVSAVASLGILGAAVASFFALSSLRKPPEQHDEVVPTPRVLTQRVERHDDGVLLRVDGVVVPFREIHVAAEVGGRIVAKSDDCRAGRFVRAGALLLEIDHQDYELEVERLKQELAQADAMLNELETELHGAIELQSLAQKELAVRQRELKRKQDLAAVSTQVEVDQAEANELAARNVEQTLKNQAELLATRRSRLQSARSLVVAQSKKAELDLERTRIRAPVDGVIVEDNVESDSFVQKGAPLYTIEDTSKVEISSRLRMDDLFWLWDEASALPHDQAGAAKSRYELPQREVEVVYRLGPTAHEYTWKGRLSRYDGIGLDEKTRTVPVRIVVDDPRQDGSMGPPALVRGMYVAIRIAVHPQATLLRVPEKALRPGNRVWRVADGRLTIERVQFIDFVDLAGSDEQAAVVRAEPGGALAAGDEVVITPLAYVRTGMNVQAAAEGNGS
jgi:multidrug efflux pump subunit AcrA (membrane-fusion protein)